MKIPKLKPGPSAAAIATMIAIAMWALPGAASDETAEPVSTAAPSPSSSPVVSPAPVPTVHPVGFHVTSNARLTLIEQNFGGPGTRAPEAANYVSGALPLAPNTPYDMFSSTPQVSGDSGIGDISSQISYGLRAFDFRIGIGVESVRGSITNATYLGENLMPTVNPHLGSQALPYAMRFPGHAGQDDGTATRVSVLSGTIATADGNLALRAGWFDLAQTDRFVFAQPNLTNLNPAIAYTPPETLTSGVAGLDGWQSVSSALPLQGIDLVAKHGLATLEATNAALPSQPGQSARLTMGSIVFDRGEGTRFSAQLAHVTLAGAPFSTSVPFGANPAFTPYAQGIFGTSILSGERETIAGVRGTFHVIPVLGLDGIMELGRSWYDSTLAARPGSASPGGYYHAGLIETHGHVSEAIDCYRMEPRYATMILPYGIAENTWAASFAWPGQWPAGNYQLVDNSAVAANRQGYRLRVALDKTPIELHMEYTNVRQIEAETVESSIQLGFVDPYYLAEQSAKATFGRQKRIGLWAAWHPAFGDVTLDLIDDMLYRPFVATHLEDGVSYEVPQAVLAYSRHLSSNVVLSTGVGRFSVKGTFSESIDFSERLFFLGAEIAQTPSASLLISFRRTASGGITTLPSLQPSSPNYNGTALIVEQRVRF